MGEGLSDSDRDALHTAMAGVLPRTPREKLPEHMAELLARGLIEITLTDDEIIVQVVTDKHRHDCCRVRRPRVN